MNIGEKLKALRTKHGKTLKELASEANLSVGFISQFERGKTTIDVKHLQTIADIFNVNIQYFFDDSAAEQLIIRSYDQKIDKQLNHTIYKPLSSAANLTMQPEILILLPTDGRELPQAYTHEGEEFVYVLEGTLTLVINDQIYRLYPGDATHFSSMRPHNWGNQSNTPVKMIVVHDSEHDDDLQHRG